MRSFAIVMVTGLVLALALAAKSTSKLVYTLSVSAAQKVVELNPGQAACQGPIEPPRESFDRVSVGLGPGGQPVDVIIRSLATKRVLTRGHLAAAGSPESAVPVARATIRERSEICVRNAGTGKQQLLGQIDLANRTSSATVDGRLVNADLALRLENAHARSLLSRLPQVAQHAALFKPGWVGAWTIWLLGGLVVIAVPLLLARAVADATRDGV